MKFDEFREKYAPRGALPTDLMHQRRTVTRYRVGLVRDKSTRWYKETYPTLREALVVARALYRFWRGFYPRVVVERKTFRGGTYVGTEIIQVEANKPC